MVDDAIRLNAEETRALAGQACDLAMYVLGEYGELEQRVADLEAAIAHIQRLSADGLSTWTAHRLLTALLQVNEAANLAMDGQP